MRFRYWVVLLLLLSVGIAYGLDRTGFVKLPRPDLNFWKHIKIEETQKIGDAPVSEQSWCRKQNINPGDSVLDPVSKEILGWDWESDACVYRLTGFDCALNRTVTLDYAVTASVGGVVAYVRVDGFYGDPAHYAEYVEHLDKYYWGRQFCDDLYYPIQLR